MAGNGLRGQDFAPAFSLETNLWRAADILAVLELLLQRAEPAPPPALLATLVDVALDAVAQALEDFAATRRQGGGA